MAKKTITDKNGNPKEIEVAESEVTPVVLPPGQRTEDLTPKQLKDLKKENPKLQIQEQKPPKPNLPPGITPKNPEKASKLDIDNPNEGDSFTHPNGDIETFKNGTWVVKVSHSPRTGE